jgi:hypothetical protein
MAGNCEHGDREPHATREKEVNRATTLDEADKMLRRDGQHGRTSGGHWFRLQVLRKCSFVNRHAAMVEEGIVY